MGYLDLRLDSEVMFEFIHVFFCWVWTSMLCISVYRLRVFTLTLQELRVKVKEDIHFQHMILIFKTTILYILKKLYFLLSKKFILPLIIITIHSNHFLQRRDSSCVRYYIIIETLAA